MCVCVCVCVRIIQIFAMLVYVLIKSLKQKSFLFLAER